MAVSRCFRLSFVGGRLLGLPFGGLRGRTFSPVFIDYLHSNHARGHHDDLKFR